MASEPLLLIKTSNPRKFCSEFFALSRKISSNPQFEMWTAMFLAQFGFPNFEGVSETDNLTLAYFLCDGKKELFICVSSDDSSMLAKHIIFGKYQNLRIGKKLVARIGKGTVKNFSDYAKTLVDLSVHKTQDSIYVRVDSDYLLELLKNYYTQPAIHLEALIKDTDYCEFSINENGNFLKSKFNLVAKKSSELERFFRTASNHKNVDEISFIPDSSFIVFLSATNNYKETFIPSFFLTHTKQDFFKKSQLEKFFNGTSACAYVLLNGDLSTVSVSKISGTFEDVYKAVLTAQVELSQRELNGEKLGVVKKTSGNNEMFFVKNDYLVSSDSEILLGQVMEKMDSPTSKSPLYNLKGAGWDYAFYADFSKLDSNMKGNNQLVVRGRFYGRKLENVAELPYELLKVVFEYTKKNNLFQEIQRGAFKQ